MSRMLEALKQIEARSPQPRPVVKPVSPEELESFGLRQPAEPAQSAVLREQTQEPPAGTMAQQTAPEVVPAAEPDRDAGRVSTPLAEPHREAYWELADSILGQLSPVRPAVLLFTSAGDGEGKTCTLASLLGGDCQLPLGAPEGSQKTLRTSTRAPACIDWRLW